MKAIKVINSLDEIYQVYIAEIKSRKIQNEIYKIDKKTIKKIGYY